jgi:undecaprenyl-phosphate galactose phosphotransferase
MRFLIKDLIDYLVIISILPIIFLIHIIILILIKKEKNINVLFKQPRIGKNNKNFICYKYTTMYPNGDEILKKYLENNPDEVEYYNKFHKYKKDPRITKIGKFLRSSSLDELPQFINVLKGEMSIVGPRPYMLNEEKKIKNKNIILSMKPGITGLWQISGRNNLSFKHRNKLDVKYIKKWSLLLDLIIVIKTFKVVFLKIGAK